MNKEVIEAINKMNVVMTFQSPIAHNLFKTLGLHANYCAVPTQEIAEEDNVPGFEILEMAASKKVTDIETLYASYGQTLDLVVGHQEYIKYNCLPIIHMMERSHLENTLHRLSGHSYTVFVSLVIKMGEKIATISDQTTVHVKKLRPTGIGIYEGTKSPGEKQLSPFGINGILEMLIEKVEGDVFVLSGVPLFKFNRELAQMLAPPVVLEKSLFTTTKHFC